MKLIVQLSLILALLFSTEAWAQKMEGIATYKTQRKMDIQLDSSQVDDGMKEQIMAMMKKQSEKEFTLQFSQDESLYTEVEKLDKPSGMTGGMVFEVQVIGDGAGDVLYKNLAQNRYTNQTESFSKQFLIKDQIKAREWKLEKESKNIGNYACFKATYTYERPVQRVMSFSINDASEDESEETEEETPEMETITVTAWYTPQIPVKNGPSQYDGLPGMILEISDGNLSVLCSKVVLNPNGGIDLKEPKGGKEVTQEKYEAMMDKKMKEMEEQFQSDGRRNQGGHGIEIRIGG